MGKELAAGRGKECPRCGLLNLDSALACDCGRLFDPIAAAESLREVAKPESRSISSPEHSRPTVGSLALVVALIAGAVGLGIVFGKRSDGTAPLPDARAQDAGGRAPPYWDNPEWYEGIFCETVIHWGRNRLKFYKFPPTHEGTGWITRQGKCTFKRNLCPFGQLDRGDDPQPVDEFAPTRAPASFSASFSPKGISGMADVVIFGPCFETKMAFCYYPLAERGRGVKVHHLANGAEVKEGPTCFLEWAQCEKQRTNQSVFDNVSGCLPMEWRDGALRLFEGG